MIDPNAEATSDSAAARPEAAADLSEADVRKIARLARIRLAEDPEAETLAVARLSSELRDVLGHIDRLRSLEVEGVEPLSRPHGGVNRLDDDEPGPVLDPATIRNAAHLTEGPFIAVPKVLGANVDGS